MTVAPPWREDHIIGRRGGRRLRRLDQATSLQRAYRMLNRALREPGLVRDLLQAGGHAALTRATLHPCPRPEIQEHKECRRLLVMPDEIGHQAVDHVTIEH